MKDHQKLAAIEEAKAYNSVGKTLAAFISAYTELVLRGGELFAENQAIKFFKLKVPKTLLMQVKETTTLPGLMRNLQQVHDEYYEFEPLIIKLEDIDVVGIPGLDPKLSHKTPYKPKYTPAERKAYQEQQKLYKRMADVEQRVVAAMEGKLSPTDKDKKLKACYKCGSTEHLKRDCPEHGITAQQRKNFAAFQKAMSHDIPQDVLEKLAFIAEQTAVKYPLVNNALVAMNCEGAGPTTNMPARFKDIELNVAVDSYSSHNFISFDLAIEWGLELKSIPPLHFNTLPDPKFEISFALAKPLTIAIKDTEVTLKEVLVVPSVPMRLLVAFHELESKGWAMVSPQE